MEVTIIKALFGREHLKFGSLKEWESTLLYEVSLLGSFGFAHMWRISKSIQQRCFTQHFDESATDEERFVAVAKKENLVTLQMRRKRFVDLYNRGKSDADQMEVAALDVDRISSYKESVNTSEFAPVIVIWVLRLTIGLQAYMYHSIIGQFHLSWILMSFIFSNKVTLWISTLIMVPLYTFEFIIVYGGQLRVVKDVSVFK